MSAHFPGLNRLGVMARLGLSLLVLTMLGGYFMAGVHLLWHYENRDGVEGMSRDDITAAYHGIEQESPLLASLERGHPEGLPADDRDALIAWIHAGAPGREYDDFESGEMAPAEVIDRSCLSCHARSSTDPIGQRTPLEFYDDVAKLAVSREVMPNSREIVAASIHAHAPSMAVVMIVLGMMALCTPVPRRLTGAVLLVGAVGLAMDFAGQWFARDFAAMSWAVIVGGFLSSGGTFVLGLLSVIGLWIPGKEQTAQRTDRGP